MPWSKSINIFTRAHWKLSSRAARLIEDFQYLIVDFFLFRFIRIGVGRSDLRAFPCSNNITIVLFNERDLYSLKLLGILANCWRLNGFEIHALIGSNFTFFGKLYMSLFGINRFVVYKPEFDINRLPRSVADDILDMQSNIDDGITTKSLVSLKYADTDIGRCVFGQLTRYLKLGSLDFNDAAHINLLKEAIKEYICHAYALKSHDQLLGSSCFLTYEVNYPPYSILIDYVLHNNKQVVQVIQPYQDDALILKNVTSDNKRLHPAAVEEWTLKAVSDNFSLPVVSAAVYEILQRRYNGYWHLQKRNQNKTFYHTKSEICNTLLLDSEKPIAVIFSHVPWDANLFYGEDLFESFDDWFISTLLEAAKNKNVSWVIKIHPANVWKNTLELTSPRYEENRLLEKTFKSLPEHIKLLSPLTPISTLSLFENADYGITVRGTPGLEMACFGKAVITAGTGRYSNLGFTHDSHSKHHYLFKIRHIHNIPLLSKNQSQLAQIHLYILFAIIPFKLFSFKTVPRSPGSSRLNMQLLSQSVESIPEFHLIYSWYLRSFDTCYCSPALSDLSRTFGRINSSN